MIIGVDFDGTVVTHDYPRVGKDIGAVPVLKRLVDAGNQLVLFTMRSTQNGTFQDAVKWFEKNGIELYGKNTNPTQKAWTDSPKAHCHLYIDDAAFGAPLKFDESKSMRPFIDWEKAEKMLEYYGAFDGETNDEEEDVDDNDQDDNEKNEDDMNAKTIKINEAEIRQMVKESVKKVLKEYRDRKSYMKASDKPFIDRMNQFADKYGYDRFTYGKKQGIDPEAYAKNLIKRHNTFLRGVDTNMASDEALAYAKEELKKQGISNPTMQQIAQFAATNPMKGNKGYYASNVGNADIYGNGGTKQKNGHFAGTAKIIRPYQLGNDRMKWFDEGDFQVRGANDYNVDGYENNQQSVNAQIGNGEVVDTWNTGNEGNSEVQIGGQTNFGGWLTGKERQHGQNTKANNRWNQILQRIGGKRRNGQKLSQKEQDIERYPMKYAPKMYTEYNTWLTTRNNHKRQ